MESNPKPEAADADADAPIAELRDASKHYSAVVAVEGLNLSIRRGEFLSFLGPSGCGKTTALRMLAGFESPTAGDVLLPIGYAESTAIPIGEYLAGHPQ